MVFLGEMPFWSSAERFIMFLSSKAFRAKPICDLIAFILFYVPLSTSHFDSDVPSERLGNLVLCLGLTACSQGGIFSV